MVDFCSNCGAIIMGKKGEAVACPSCGESQKAKASIKLSEKVTKVEEKEIVDSDDSAAEIHPLIKAECSKCKHEEAYFWTKQTRSGDEAETSFYKCVKCRNTWRLYR